MSFSSMTGHGVGDAAMGSARVVVEIRTVNHRYLDVRVRLPSEINAHAGVVETLCRESLGRGRVELTARIEAPATETVTLDTARARDAFRQLAELRDELAPGQPLPMSLLSSVPELFRSGSQLDLSSAKSALDAATRDAIEAVWTMRNVEGKALAEDLAGHLEHLEAEVAAIRARLPTMVDEYRAKLRTRLERLLADTETTLDTGRLEQEVAVLADKSDVAEELSRLTSHAGQLRALLTGEGREIGKRLDFLLQEMTREANTVGSKSADAELAQRVVSMKTAITRMREQAQNVV
ncbi:MAG: YicC/YloC family endoribonuclease [Sandaracinaceae bacterium]